MKPDIHQTDSCYEIRSLYFDDYDDSCMGENEAGVDQRQKYRIRIYDTKGEVIHLEIKEKNRGYTKKTSCSLTLEECQQIMDGTIPTTIDNRAPLNMLKLQMRSRLMRPKVIITYERSAFVHPSGNVRVTFDRNITASRYCDDFFEERVPVMIPILPARLHILEVKYDEILPDVIAKQLEIGKLRQTAFSKYYLGRLALRGDFPVDR